MVNNFWAEIVSIFKFILDQITTFSSRSHIWLWFIICISFDVWRVQWFFCINNGVSLELFNIHYRRFIFFFHHHRKSFLRKYVWNSFLFWFFSNSFILIDRIWVWLNFNSFVGKFGDIKRKCSDNFFLWKGNIWFYRGLLFKSGI